MYKALFKKQFLELYTKMATSRKSGKKMSLVGFIIMWTAILLAVGVALYFLALFFSITLLPAGLDWLYFTMMGLITVGIALIGNAFMAYTMLYNSQDNDMLLSMPIPPSRILLARMISVFLVGLLYCFIIWVPTLICYFINGTPTVISVVFSILMLFMFAIFVLVLSSILGWIIALISSRVKNKTATSVIVALVVFALYYFLYFRMNTALQSFAANVEAVESAMQGWGYPFYVVGLACAGNAIPMISCILTVAILFAICYFVLSKTFIKISTRNVGTKKNEYREKQVKITGAKFALLKRELIHFKNSTAYMLNCGIGILFTIAIGVLLIIKSGSITPIFEEALPLLLGELSWIASLIYVGIICLLGMIISMNTITPPSVSLEGKNLWIVRSFPVDPKDVLNSKIKLQLVLTLLPIAFISVVAGLIVKAPIHILILFILYGIVYAIFCAVTGLFLGLRKPSFDWATETVPIKTSSAVVISIFGGWGVNVLIAGIYVLFALVFGVIIPAYIYILIWIVIFGVVAFITWKWLNTKGAEKFNTL